MEKSNDKLAGLLNMPICKMDGEDLVTLIKSIISGKSEGRL